MFLNNKSRGTPLSEMDTLASVTGIGESDRFTGLVEHCMSTGKSPVVVPSAIVAVQPQPAQGCNFLLMNPTSEVAVLHKGTKVAQLSCILNNEEVANVVKKNEYPVSIPSDAEDVLWRLVESSGEILNPQQQIKLYNLLLEFADVFAFSDSNLGQTHVSCHKIPTEPVPPIKQQIRRILPYSRREISNLFGDMLARDIIQPSTSPWASPIVIVCKKDGSARFCVDYRRCSPIGLTM